MGREKEALCEVEDASLVLVAPKQVAELTNQDREQWQKGDRAPSTPFLAQGREGMGTTDRPLVYEVRGKFGPYSPCVASLSAPLVI